MAFQEACKREYIRSCSVSLRCIIHMAFATFRQGSRNVVIDLAENSKGFAYRCNGNTGVVFLQ
jgi:hypothetical protein